MTLRLWFPLLGLLIAGTSIAVERRAPMANDAICRRGACGYAQMYASLDARGATRDALAALVELDPSNPHAVANYGDFLAATGQTDAARRAFAQAETLGAGLAPVLMRVANFSFTHDRRTEARALVPRILTQTGDYDQILFSYLQLLELPPAQLVGSTIPASPRAAESWLMWTLGHGTTGDVVATWAWVREQGLANLIAATRTVNTLWQRKAYVDAQQVWVAWLGSQAGQYPTTARLDDARFEREPTQTPFDWDLAPRAGLTYSRGDGLEVRFLGQANITDAGVRQYAVVSPGRYRLVADISADSISTDEGVFFQVTDLEHPDQLRVQLNPIRGTLARTTMTLDVTVPQMTQVVSVELARRASVKFDNQVSGVLHVYRLALEPE